MTREIRVVSVSNFVFLNTYIIPDIWKIFRFKQGFFYIPPQALLGLSLKGGRGEKRSRTFHRVFSPPQAEKISDNLGFYTKFNDPVSFALPPKYFLPPPFKKSPRDRPFPPRTFHRVFSPPQAEKISDNLGLFLARKTTKEMQAKKFWTCFHLEVRCRPKRFGLGLFFVVPFWIFFGLHTFLRIGEWKKQKSQSRAPQWKIIFYSSSPLGIFSG